MESDIYYWGSEETWEQFLTRVRKEAEEHKDGKRNLGQEDADEGSTDERTNDRQDS